MQNHYNENEEKLPNIVQQYLSIPLDQTMNDPWSGNLVLQFKPERKLRNIGFPQELLEDFSPDEIGSIIQRRNLKNKFENTIDDLLVTTDSIRPWTPGRN